MKKIAYTLLFVCLVFAALIGKEVFDITDKGSHWDIKLVGRHTCDLQSSKCEFLYKGKLGHFKALETPIIINKTNIVQVELENISDEEIWIDIKGIELDMGYNRVRLKRKGSLFEGKIYLPSCSLKVMTWEVMLIIKSGDKRLGHVYKLKTVKL